MQKVSRFFPRIKLALHSGRAIRLVWESSPAWFIANSVLVLVLGVLPLASLYLLKLIVDSIERAQAIADLNESIDHIIWLIILAAGISLLTAFARSASNLVTEAQSQVVTDHVQDMLHSKSITIDLEYFENPQYHDTLHRAQKDALSRPTQIVNSILGISLSVCSLLAVAGLLAFSLHWLLVVVLLLAAIPDALVRFLYSDQLYRWQRKSTALARREWYYNAVLTRDVHAKEIRLYQIGKFLKNRSRALRRRLRIEKRKIGITRSSRELMASLSQIIAIYGTFTFIAYQTLAGALTLGSLLMYFYSFQRGQTMLQELSKGLSGLYESNLFLNSLFEFLNLEPKVTEPTDPKPLIWSRESDLTFDNISFQYPGSDKKVLEDISLSIAPGEHIAFVGENGSGKTSLIKLLCRLYDPTEGRITLGGIDVREFSTESLRREINVIFQDYAQYQMTVRENIWLGDVNLPVENSRVITASQHAGADEFIANLNDNYETQLGRWFDNGEELSTGQWQKIALARAFMREGRLLVLDEPTSALDAKAEYDLFKRFHKIARNRTVILISHRLSTVKMVDRIYVLKGGRIIESGSHANLIRREGTYARLYKLQASHYD